MDQLLSLHIVAVVDQSAVQVRQQRVFQLDLRLLLQGFESLQIILLSKMFEAESDGLLLSKLFVPLEEMFGHGGVVISKESHEPYRIIKAGTPGLKRNDLDVSDRVELFVDLVLDREVLRAAVILQAGVQDLYQVVLLLASEHLESFEVAHMSLLKLSEFDICQHRRPLQLDCQELGRSVGVRGPATK